MKTQTSISFTTLSETDLEQLTAQVKETVATQLNLLSSKHFTAADLWRIRRQRNTTFRRRGLVFI